MNNYFALTLFLFFYSSISAQKEMPHKFKELKRGATLEAIKDHGEIKLYMLVDDIEQYDQIQIERGDEFGTNYTCVKVVDITKGKFKNNYLETVDRFPVSSKMGGLYRVKVVEHGDGFIKMFAPVQVVSIDSVLKR